MKDREVRTSKVPLPLCPPSPSYEQGIWDRTLTHHFHLGKDSTNPPDRGPAGNRWHAQKGMSRAQQRDEWPRSGWSSCLHWGFPGPTTSEQLPRASALKAVHTLGWTACHRIGGRAVYLGPLKSCVTLLSFKDELSFPSISPNRKSSAVSVCVAVSINLLDSRPFSRSTSAWVHISSSQQRQRSSVWSLCLCLALQSPPPPHCHPSDWSKIQNWPWCSWNWRVAPNYTQDAAQVPWWL